MKPGEIITCKDGGDIIANQNLETITIKVSNCGDRPIQIGSHIHFFEVNQALEFNRDKARGFRLQPKSTGFITIKFQCLVHFKKMNMAPNLNGSVSTIADFNGYSLEVLIGDNIAPILASYNFSGFHLIGLCTVTSLVPSGKVASTWTS